MSHVVTIWVLELRIAIVTDMLIAILNCCTKEELEEEEETPMAITPEDIEEGEWTAANKPLLLPSLQADSMAEDEEDPQGRRNVIKNKILAVGRMSRVFALLR